MEAWRTAVLAANRELSAALDKVTRVEVINEHGRAYGAWNIELTPSLQDDGRTLKLFVAPLSPETKSHFPKWRA